jgi:hypothetical protein
MILLASCAMPPPSYTPDLFGAVGDGVHDDGPDLAALIEEATLLDVPVDLSGTWYVADTVLLTAGGRMGTIEVLPGSDLDAVVVLDLPSDAVLEGTLTVVGAPAGGAWRANRLADDGVHVLDANGAQIERIVVRYVRRYAVRTGGGNTIGASVGSVLATYAGTSGLVGDPVYARQSTTATAIVRTGAAGGFAQRATLTTTDPLDVVAGDYLLVGGPLATGGDLVEVVSVTGTSVVVYPWPLGAVGTGAWPVEVVAGGGVRLHGGNTAAMRIGTVKLQHGGHALHVTAGYGGQVGALLGEVVGSTLTVGARAQTVQALSVLGPLHSEIDLVDVLVGGTGVANAVVISPTQALVAPRVWHVTPTTTSPAGEVHATYPWPVTSVPGAP